MAISDSAVAHRAKAGWPFGELNSRRFGAVPLAYTTDAPRGSAGSFTCAWHDALAGLPAYQKGAGSKTPTVTGRKGNTDKARAG
ncbi:MAG: hypothetical protein JRF35_15795, partial [Deltaproteobacteria bacterium]|nr:hypothetical protein [Deltaproteobacteria bacterium]